MGRRYLIWSRSKGISLKKIKGREKLQLLLFGMMFLIFVIVLYCELHLMKNPKQTLKINQNQSQPHVSKILFNAILTWFYNIKEKFYNIQSKSNVSDLTQNRHSFHQDFHWHSIDTNISFYVFNSTATFHKLFRKWLGFRSTKIPVKIKFTLNHRRICIDRGRNLSILIAVTSSASHLESRLAIRDTWGGYARQRGAKLLFFLGVPKNSKYHSRINEENTKFRDIIQSSFLDTYANLTLKTISVLKWVSEVCSFVKYVLKVDDDMFINIENIMNVTENKNASKTIFGELAHEWAPVRSVKNKWYTSYHDYPFNIYPDFVFGPSYLLTGDAVKLLYDASIKMNTFHLEDVYITGFVAEKLNIERINLPAMFNTPRDLQPCNFKKLLSSHGHTPPDMRRHWMWLNRRNFQCV